MISAFLILFHSFGQPPNDSKIEQQYPATFHLRGKVAGRNDGIIFLNYTNLQSKRINDSCKLVNGSFSFKGDINQPTMAYMQLKEEKRNELNSVSFFLEPSVMSVKLQFNAFRNARFSGSKTQNEYAKLNDSKNVIEKKYQKQLDSLRTEKDHDKNAEIRERLAPYFSEMDQEDYEFFGKHPQSYVTMFVMRFHVVDLPLDSLEMFYDRLGARLHQTNDGKNLAEEIQKLRGGSPGSMAKNFSVKDINGSMLNLSDFKGKYVLLDFWASWCVPCRKGNPHLKEMYAKYKNMGKGIEFIGVSDDDSKPDAWYKAVEKDGLPWRHVLRGLDMQKILKGEHNESDISEKFGIHSLPTKILIDPDGKIIGRYGDAGDEGEAMNKKFAEIFGE